MYKETLPKSSGLDSHAANQTPAQNGMNGLTDEPTHSGFTGSKINQICGAFLEALKGRQDTNLRNIVTAHVCKSPPDLDAGLLLVAKLRGIMRTKSYPCMESDMRTGEDMSKAEKAVEHICFLADVNRLFDHALGLYDLELTLLVAQQSQKAR